MLCPAAGYFNLSDAAAGAHDNEGACAPAKLLTMLSRQQNATQTWAHRAAAQGL